jgi:hypothetical protein
MPVLTVFYIKLLINLALTIGIIWTISRSDLFSKWQQENDKLIFTLGFVLFRLIPWIGIFLIVNEEPRGDIPFFFYKAEGAKAGGFVYRDFWSYHAPLYAYIISIPVWIWHNARAIVLFMVLMETAILWLTYDTYKSKSPKALQLAAIYYMLPAAFMYILVDGQEEVWFWGAALLIWRYTIKNRSNYEVGIGLLYAMTLLTIKVTFIFLLPALLVMVKKPVENAAGHGGDRLAGRGFPVLADRRLIPDAHPAYRAADDAQPLLGTPAICGNSLSYRCEEIDVGQLVRIVVYGVHPGLYGRQSAAPAHQRSITGHFHCLLRVYDALPGQRDGRICDRLPDGRFVRNHRYP